MARGWESKSVEEQINEREAEAQQLRKEKPSRLEIEQRSKQEGIRLARSRTTAAMECTHDERYRALLQRTLDRVLSLPFASPSALLFARSKLPKAYEMYLIGHEQHDAIVEAIEKRHFAE